MRFEQLTGIPNRYSQLLRFDFLVNKKQQSRLHSLECTVVDLKAQKELAMEGGERQIVRRRTTKYSADKFKEGDDPYNPDKVFRAPSFSVASGNHFHSGTYTHYVRVRTRSKRAQHVMF